MQIVLDVPEQYANLFKDLKSLEACFRQNNAKFKEFIKLAVSKDKSVEEVGNEILNALKTSSESVNHSINIVNNSLNDLKDNIGSFTNAADKILNSTQLANTMSFINVGLNAINLCATVAGFAIMSEQMDQISKDLSRVSKDVKDVKEHLDLLDQKEVKDLMNQYANFLNKKDNHEEISLDEKFDLLNKMYLTMDLLIQCFNKDVGNRKTYLDSISMLLPMYILTLIDYDKSHYFKYGKLHGNRETYTRILDEFKSYDFFKSVQEYAFLHEEMNLNSRESFDAAFIYITKICEQIVAVEDNILIIKHFKNLDEYEKFQSIQAHKIVDCIKESAAEISSEETSEQLLSIINKELSYSNQ